LPVQIEQLDPKSKEIVPDNAVLEQIAAGLVEEVRGLLATGYAPSLPSMQGLGYKEIAAALNEQTALGDAVVTLKRNTRRFAKRQYTWFRADPRIRWIDVDDLDAEQVARAIHAMIE